ncbi:MAG: hypothetical protein ABSB18_05650 [Candidatus Omnitrophota bacterium]
MKKITSVFITAFVFFFGFMNMVFAESVSSNLKGNDLTNRKKKLPSGKVESLESMTYKMTDMNKDKFTNLEVNKNATLEAGKIDDLNKTNIKFDNLGKGEDLNKKANPGTDKMENLDKTGNKEQELGWELKSDDLERKR